jgi:hypothetical protein
VGGTGSSPEIAPGESEAGVMKTRVFIDEKSARRLLEGKPVTVRLPPNATEIEFRIAVPVRERNTTAELFDVFFNGRKAAS